MIDEQAKSPCYGFEELRSKGMLWLINRAVFHPRGYALALHYDDNDNPCGWSVQFAGAGEQFTFGLPDDVQNKMFQAVEAILLEAKIYGTVPHQDTAAQPPSSVRKNNEEVEFESHEEEHEHESEEL